jgi:hypothetical protein
MIARLYELRRIGHSDGSVSGMASEKVTVTFEASLLQLMREAAERGGDSLSGWLAAASRDRLRRDGAKSLAQWAGTGEGKSAREAVAGATRKSLKSGRSEAA